jgi:hypothetical protein
MSRFSRVAPFLLIPLAAALGACSSAKPAFQDDQLLSSAPSPFSRGFNYASTDACEASRRALLSQGYMTTLTHSDTVDATKNFQPTVDQHIVVEVHVVCTPADATNTSMVYVNAVQNGYGLKKSATSASVGLSILGSVSLPIHTNSDEMVKISSATIQSGEFYTRFFDLVGRYLNTVARSEPVPANGGIKITPLPPTIVPVTANVAAPGVSPAPAAAAAAAAAAATGAAVLHTEGTPATPAQAAMAVPAAPVASSGVHAVFPAAPASQATLLTPDLPASAPAGASAPTTSAAAPGAASAPAAGSNHAEQPGAAAPASGASAVKVNTQPVAASAPATAAAPAVPSSAAASGTQTVAAASLPAPSGPSTSASAANTPTSNAKPAAAPAP